MDNLATGILLFELIFFLVVLSFLIYIFFKRCQRLREHAIGELYDFVGLDVAIFAIEKIQGDWLDANFVPGRQGGLIAKDIHETHLLLLNVLDVLWT